VAYPGYVLHPSIEILPEIRHFIWKSGRIYVFMLFAGFSPQFIEISAKLQYREWSEPVSCSDLAVALRTEESWFDFLYEAKSIFF